MPNLKFEITQRGIDRGKDGIQRFISKEILYEKVLSNLIYRFSSDWFDKNNKQR